MLAFGAMAPDCSTSRVVSSDPFASLTAPAPPSTLSSEIRPGFVLIFSTDDQKCVTSEDLRLARVTMPMVWPWPVWPAFSSGVRPYWLEKFPGVRLPVCTAAGLRGPGG